MEEKNILINGLNINYKTTEGGQPLLDFAGIKVFPDKFKERGTVLILHGWGGSSDSWLEVQRILAKKGYKVIVPDLPGFGKSATPLTAWGINNYTNFIFKFVKEVELEKFFLLGHSFGGRISVKFAMSYPEMLKALILCDSAGIRPKPGLKTMLIFWLARLGSAIFTPKHLVRFKDSVRNFFYIIIRHRDYEKAKGVMKETIKKVLDEDLMLDLSEIKKKTLIIWGAVDKMVPLKYAHIFKEKIKDSELEVIPKIGHSPHIEAPRKLAEIILNFLSKNI